MAKKTGIFKEQKRKLHKRTNENISCRRQKSMIEQILQTLVL